MESGSSLTFVTPTEEGLLEQVQQNLQKEAGKAEEVKEGRGRGKKGRGRKGGEGRGKGGREGEGREGEGREGEGREGKGG